MKLVWKENRARKRGKVRDTTQTSEKIIDIWEQILREIN